MIRPEIMGLLQNRVCNKGQLGTVVLHVAIMLLQVHFAQMETTVFSETASVDSMSAMPTMSLPLCPSPDLSSDMSMMYSGMLSETMMPGSMSHLSMSSESDLMPSASGSMSESLMPPPSGSMSDSLMPPPSLMMSESLMTYMLSGTVMICIPPMSSSLDATDSSSMMMDSSHAVMESSSMMMDSSYPAMDMSSMMMDSSHAVMESSSMMMDSSYPAMDMSSMMMDSSYPVMDMSSMMMDSSYPAMDMSSMMHSSHPAMDMSSMMMDSSYLTMDMSSMMMDSSHPAMDMSSMMMDSSHPAMDMSSMMMDSSHPAMDMSSMMMDSSHPAMDMSSMMDSSHPAMDSSPMMDSSHPAMGPSSMMMDSSHPAMDSSPMMMDSSHPAMDSSPMMMDSSHPAMDSSPMMMDTSYGAMDSSPMMMDSSYGAMDSSSMMIGPSSAEMSSASSAVITSTTTSTTQTPTTTLPPINTNQFNGCFIQRGKDFLSKYEAYSRVFCARTIIPDIATKLSELTLPDGTLWTINLNSSSLEASSDITPNCSAFDFSGQSNETILSELQAAVTDAISFFTTQAGNDVNSAVSCGNSALGSRQSEFSSVINSYNTNATAQITALKTYFENLLAKLKEITGCSGTLDCAGVCNGQAMFHAMCKVCYGGSTNYTAVNDFLDCNNECFGTATTNECDECYGGNTGLSQTHGIDSCNGQCTGKPGYVNTTDCNGVCNGTAVIDSCSSQCVGGDTGRTAADFRDCNNICNGDGVNDTCGFCVSNSTIGSTGSPYKDCNNDCYTPATVSQMATVNDCGQCVGGNTGKTADAGKDLCGICGGDNSTCLDCAGVPNGGRVDDACGVCGGPGTSCLSVTSLSLDYVPSGVTKTVTADGAGFSSATVECVFVNQTTNAETVVSKTAVSAVRMTVTIPSTLAVGMYKLQCRQSSGQALAASTANLTVYDSTSTTVTSMTPTTFQLSAGGSETIQASGTGFVSDHTYCHVKVGSAADVITSATVASSTSATCSVSHPAKSSEIQVWLSLNRVDRIGTITTITAQAAAPTATAKFTNAGDMVVVTFSTAVNRTSLTTCAAIFQDVTSLGGSASCSFKSQTVMIIESTTAPLNTVLNLKANAVKAAGENFALSASGSITLAPGSNPVTPVGVIRGSSKIGSCSELKLDAFGSSGGGGRPLNYTWSIVPSSGLTLGSTNTAEFAPTGTSVGTTYTVTLQVCNFMGPCHTATLSVQKLSAALPDIFITANTDIKNIQPSEGFTLSSNAKLPSCVNDTLKFAWTFSGAGVRMNTATRRDYVVRSGDFPADATITATVTVSLLSAPDRTVQQSVTLETKAGNLVAAIKGPNAITIGTTSGQLVLDGSGSNDPDNAPGSLNYEWTCVKFTAPSTRTGCLDRDGAGLPASSAREAAILSIPTSSLLPSPDFVYIFKLTVSKSSRSAMSEATVTVVDGSPPKVSFSGVAEKVAMDSVLGVAATIESTTTVTVRWETEVKNGFGYIDLSDNSNLETTPTLTTTATNKYVSVLAIRKGVLQRGTKYSFKCSVTDLNSKTSVATKEYYIYNGVTSCSVSGPGPYTELNQINVLVSNCFSDADGLPLNFTLYQASSTSDTFRTLSTTQDNGKFSLRGPQADSTGKIVFAIIVCAKRGGCSTYKTGQITVSSISASQVTAMKTAILSEIDTLEKEGNIEGALVKAAIYIDKSTNAGASRRRRSAILESLRRHRRHAEMTSDVALLLIRLAHETVAAGLSESTGNTVLGVLTVLPASSVSNSDMLNVTTLYLTLVNYFHTNNIKMTVAGVFSVDKWLMDVKTRSVTGTAVTQLTEIFQKARRVGYTLYESQVFTLTDSVRTFSIVIPGDGHLAKGTSGIVVNFGETLKTRFAEWTCNSVTCNGVGIEFTTSNTNVDPFSTANSDIVLRATDIVDIVYADPKTGVGITDIKNLANPVMMSFAVTRPQGRKTFDCKFWDTTLKIWSTLGVTVDIQTSSVVNCKSNHLTAFAAFAGVAHSSEDKTVLIVCVTLGVIVAIVIICAVAFYLVRTQKRKKQHRLITPEPAPTESRIE